MHAPNATLKPLSSISLTTEQQRMLTWLKSATWEPQSGAREPIPYKAKVPEFYSGVRLYNVQATGGAGAAQGPLALLIKKMEFQGVLSKQEMHPVAAEGAARYLTLKKIDMDNLGIGQEDYDDE